MMVGDDDKDTLFSKPMEEIQGFQFDRKVTAVFDDMINRSIPGYGHLISMIGVLSQLLIKPSSNIYDLGCSLGSVSESIIENNPDQDLCYICVDNSHYMIERCQLKLRGKYPRQNIDFVEKSINDVDISDASLVVVNFTLQFTGVDQRRTILKKIYDGLHSGGALILSEKVTMPDKQHDEKMIAIHEHFKKVNSYSDLEISQKRTALENVMCLDTLNQHYQRLSDTGFSHTIKWFQSLNFVSLLAIK